MKIFSNILGSALIVALLATSCSKEPNLGSVDMSNEIDSVSYAVGVLLSQNIQDFGELNMLAVAKGIEEGKLDLNNTKISVDQCNQMVGAYAQKSKEEKYKVNIDKGAEYMQANGENPNVVTLQSGIQYEVMAEGNGEKPAITDKVKVHYHGTLIDGTVFDSSVNRGEPAEFGLTQVIRGWTEILQQMPVGSKWKVTIPHELAYGNQSPSPAIEPYSTLIFEIELLDIITE